jgi:hypothetical protein
MPGLGVEVRWHHAAAAIIRGCRRPSRLNPPPGSGSRGLIRPAASPVEPPAAPPAGAQGVWSERGRVPY